MNNYKLTENMRLWLQKIYRESAENFYGGASNLHLMALGSNGESAGQLEYYAEEQREFGRILEAMATELEEN